MNACCQWRDSLHDFALDILPPDAARGLEEHLRHCAPCAAAAAELRRSRRQIEAGLAQLFSAAEPAPDFRARVLATAEATRSAATWRPAGAPALAGAALLLAASVLVQWPGSRWGPADPPQPRAVSLSDWRAPTDALLAPPASRLLDSGPRLGEFYFPLDSISPSPARETGGNNNES